MLTPEDRDYLTNRGYDDAAINAEQWFSLLPGQYKGWGIDVVVKEPALAILSKMPSGIVTAMQVMSTNKKDYRRFKTTAGDIFPIYYASSEDFSQLLVSEEVILVEGIFDRRAIKRCLDFVFPTYALLGLGISEKMAQHLSVWFKRVWLMLDNDKAGLEASTRATKMLTAKGLQVETIPMPVKDPDEWVRQRGVPAVKAAIEREMVLKRW